MASSQQSDHTWTSGDFEHPNPQLRWSITVGLVFAFLLSTVAVGLRFLARRLAGGRLYLDDWLMLVALVSLRITCCRSYFTYSQIANFAFQRFSNTDAQSESLHVSLIFTNTRKIDTYLQPVLYNGLGSHIDTIPPKNLEWYFKVRNHKGRLELE